MNNINEIIKKGDLDRLIRIKFKNHHEALKALKLSASQPHTSIFAYIFGYWENSIYVKNNVDGKINRTY